MSGAGSKYPGHAAAAVEVDCAACGYESGPLASADEAAALRAAHRWGRHDARPAAAYMSADRGRELTDIADAIAAVRASILELRNGAPAVVVAHCVRPLRKVEKRLRALAAPAESGEVVDSVGERDDERRWDISGALGWELDESPSWAAITRGIADLRDLATPGVDRVRELADEINARADEADPPVATVGVSTLRRWATTVRALAAPTVGRAALIPSIERALFGTEDGGMLGEREHTIPVGEFRRLLHEWAEVGAETRSAALLREAITEARRIAEEDQ